jgi:cell division protein FtsQ
MRVSAPADKRFRRAHVRPSRNRTWLAHWRIAVAIVVVGGAVAYGSYRLAGFVTAAEALTVDTITVKGTKRMSPGEVQAVLDGLRGTSMVTADLDAWRARLLESPWVGDAAIRRVFPGTVSVVISERDPLGIGRIGDALYLIDQRGAIIDEFGPGYADFDLPIIDGLAMVRRGASAEVDEERAALAGRLLADFQKQPDLARGLSQVDVSDPRDAVVILKDDPAVIRVGDERFAERVQAYLDLAARLREEVPDIDYVDLRFDERVYVKPRGEGGRRIGGS